MKRTLLAATLLAALPFAYAQTTTPGPVTGSTGAAPLGPGGSSVGQTIQGAPTVPGTSAPGTPNVSTVGGPSNSTTGSSIPSQPIPMNPSPTEPSTLGGTSISPGVLGSAPPSQGVIGMPTCAGTSGTNPCPPNTQ